jgi:hypothetical protein
MNIKEGMRRVRILLGVCGGIQEGCPGYGDAHNVWNLWTAHRISPNNGFAATSSNEFREGPPCRIACEALRQLIHKMTV